MHMRTCRFTSVHTCTHMHTHTCTDAHTPPAAGGTEPRDPAGEAAGQLCTVPRGPRAAPRRPRGPAARRGRHPPLLELQEDLGQRAAARHHGHVDGPQEAVVHPDQVLEGKPSAREQHPPEGHGPLFALGRRGPGVGGASHISVGVTQPGGPWGWPPRRPEHTQVHRNQVPPLICQPQNTP